MQSAGWRLMRPAWIYKRLYDAVHNRLGTVAGGRWAHHCRPVSISFLVTERCNARCCHCDIWKHKGPEESLTRHEWERALRGIREWLGPVHVCLTGGEALMRPFTVDLVAYGSRLGLFIELLTNGYWEDQSRIERLARARPWRVTLSLDGIGEVHDRVRGRAGFFERTSRTIETLDRVRRAEGLDFSIRLKNVVMSHNLDAAEAVARYATRPGMDVVFQPIEQNYATADDPDWFLGSDNWPRDTERAVSVVERLRAMKRGGYAIANSERELDVMIAYFRDPRPWQEATRGHTAREGMNPVCSAVGLFQVQANGDVTVCYRMPPVGNVREASPRDIWAARPRWWEAGCCRSGGSTRRAGPVAETSGAGTDAG